MVSIADLGEKREVTVVLGTSFKGGFLPLQLTFTGKTNQVLPQGEHAREVVCVHKWHLTKTENHWASLTIMKEYFDVVVLNFYKEQCQKYDMPFGKQRLLVMLHC